MFDLQITIIQSSTIIPKIRDVAPTYKNTHGFFKNIDALSPGPKFSCTPLKMKGDLTDTNGDSHIKTHELWHRDPIECIVELLGNPFFCGKQQYAPQWVFRNKDGTNQEFGEMWTTDWWWKTLVCERNIKRILRKAYLNNRNYYPLVQLLSLSSSHQTRPSSRHSVGTNRTIGNIKKQHFGNHPPMPLFFSVTSQFQNLNTF